MKENYIKIVLNEIKDDLLKWNYGNEFDEWSPIIKKIDLLLSQSIDNNWISVKDRLPNEEEHILVISNYGDHQNIYSTFFSNEYYKMNCVTHWMPLPDPPSND